jgi:N-glycosylase/DNA lyase
MITKVKGFSLDRTLSSGQIFSFFNVDKNWYSFIDKPLEIRQEGDKLVYSGLSEANVKELLGLNDPINNIKAEVDKDDFIDKAIRYSSSLRVVKSGVWPATLGFVLSIQSSVNLILRRIKAMSNYYGRDGEINGRLLKSFPSFEAIYEKGYDKLKQFNLGFRTRFVFSAAEYFYKNEISSNFRVEQLRDSLTNVYGVGEKVLDCILLYGIHDLTSFPMDVWILRTLSLYYSNILGKAKSYKDKRKAMTDYFGRYAGYAQLFIYDYSRLNSIRSRI